MSSTKIEPLRAKALSKAAAMPLSSINRQPIISRQPVRYIFNDKGKVIGEEEIPPVGSKKTKAAKDETKQSNEGWVPSHNQLSATSAYDSAQDSIDSPPDSPASSDDSTRTAKLLRNALYAESDDGSYLAEADQSSADESTPHSSTYGKKFDDEMMKFRLDTTQDSDAEEADDEALDSTQTPTLLARMDDNAATDYGYGVSQNKQEEGLSERLDQIPLGSKRVGSDVEAGGREGMYNVTKKAKTKEELEDDVLHGGYGEELGEGEIEF